jgi:leucyl-tRNA synthetase
MHLLYARFITHFLYQQKIVNFREPFTSLIHQGMILAEDGSKMSKSKGNTKAPDEYVDKYGSDILRLFMLFGFNYIDGGPWNDKTLDAITRFTKRVETLVTSCANGALHVADTSLLHVLHRSIKSVREDLDSFSFNTAVARCMELLNAIQREPNLDATKTLVLLLAPMMPHIAEELWQMLGQPPSIFDQPYPTYDPAHLVLDEVEIVVQINSKIVARVNIPTSATQDEVVAVILRSEATKDLVERLIQNNKIIYIPNKLINFITN